MYLEDARELAHAVQEPTELTQIRNLHRQIHDRAMRFPVGLNVHCRHIHILIGDYGTDITQETLSVEWGHPQINRISVCGALQPADVDHSAGLNKAETQRIGTIFSMNADTTSARDVAHDSVVGYRLANGA